MFNNTAGRSFRRSYDFTLFQRHIALVLPLLAFSVLSIGSTAYLVSGRVDFLLFERHFSLQSLDKPILIAVVLMTLAIVSSPSFARRTTHWIDERSERQAQVLVWAGALLATAAMCATRITQHRLFQTSAYDLGIQANVAWNTAHGRPFWSSIQEINYLGDHFSPVHALFALLVAPTGNAIPLLVLQSVGFGVAAVAVYQIARRHLTNRSSAILVSLLFLLNSYLHSIGSFDFHPAALAVPIFLWLLDSFERGRHSLVLFLALFAIVTEETLLPPLVAVGLYMAFVNRQARALGASIAAAAVVCFVVELGILMPYFLGYDGSTHLDRYSNLGGETLEALGRTIISNPSVIAWQLVTPPAKVAALADLLLSVAFLPLLAPREFALCVIPIVMVQLSHTPTQWGLGYHYSATILPLLVFSAIHGLGRLRRLTRTISRRVARLSPTASTVIVGTSVLMLLFVCTRRIPAYLEKHSPTRVAAAHALIASIPPEAPVCANQHFVPHLIDRSGISMFRCDTLADESLQIAQYVLLDPKVGGRGAWPCSIADYEAAVGRLRRNPEFAITREADGILLFERVVRAPQATSAAAPPG